MHDRAGALRRQRREPGVLRGDTRSAGSSASAPPPLPSPSIRHSVGRVEGDQVGEAAGDLAGQPAVLGLGRQRGALGVDHGHQRQAELGGQPHPAPGLAQRLRARAGGRRSGRAGPARGRRTAPRRSGPARSAGPGRDSPWPVPLSGTTSVAAYCSRRRTPGRSARRDRVTASQVSTSGIGSSARLGHRRDAEPRARAARQRPVEDVGDLVGGDDRVDDAVGVEVLRGLHALGERPGRRAPRRPAGPRKPTSAPGSATVTWPSEPHDAITPPVVGWRR